MNKILNTAAIVISCISYLEAGAQNNRNRYELGAAVSSFIYQGDLTIHRLGSFETMRLGFNLHGSKIMSHSFLLRANLAIGGLKGDDARYDNPEFRKQRNFNFRSPVTELSILGVWNPFRTNFSAKGISPYFFGGAGLSFVKIKRDRSNFNAAYFGDGSEVITGLALDEQQKPPRIIPAIPFGAGVRYNFSERIAINAESSYRVIFTDYLDGFSKAVNPGQKDHYHTTSVGFIYRTGAMNKLSCPVVKY